MLGLLGPDADLDTGGKKTEINPVPIYIYIYIPPSDEYFFLFLTLPFAK